MDHHPGDQPEPYRDPRLNLRVSHEERERVVERLRQAAGDGRLDIDELEERVERAMAAKTYADLQPLIADLPTQPAPAPQPRPGPVVPFTTAVGGTPAVNRSQAILGEQRREGAWVVPSLYTATAIMGNVLLDLRQAAFATPEVTVACSVLMGEVKIRIAPDVTVIDEVTTILGESRQRSSRDLPPVPYGGPVLRVRGTVVMGEVRIERLALGERRPRRWRRGQITP